MKLVRHFRGLRVYQSAFQAAMRIYELSKHWPREERYSLTDQVRRSSRAVCGAIAEAWRKRRYPKHFVSKLTDADSEAAETQGWLDFALACGYIPREEFADLNARHEAICSGLVSMMARPEQWCVPPDRVGEDEVPYGSVE